jgi:tripartite-type tricarboxylate transporter receptor subunit TctC
MMFVGPISIEAYVRTGRLRALAVADAKRLAIAPDIPTMAEAGFAGIETGTWYALLAPAGTPRAVVTRLHEVFAGVLRTPGMTARLNKQGMDVVAGAPGELRDFMKAEIAKWSRVVKAARLRVD